MGEPVLENEIGLESALVHQSGQEPTSHEKCGPLYKLMHEGSRPYVHVETATYSSPLSVFQLVNNSFRLAGIGRLDRLFADRREVKVGNKSSRFLWVRAEEDIANTNIPVINSELVEGKKSLKNV